MARDRPTVALVDDLESRIDALKDALRDLVFYHDMEDAGQAFRDMAVRWDLAWSRARDALNEDGTDDREAGDQDAGDTASLSAALDHELSKPAVDHEARLFPDDAA